ncbi:MAG: sugar ABC transporter substrate-binding protein [Christensenella sp.]|nr:sugar ABC transporter substrate-binding protein [Christensenella sp.]
MKKTMTIIALVLAVLFALAACTAAPSASQSAAATTAQESTAAEESVSAEPAAEGDGGGYTFGAVCISLNAPIWVELMEAGDACAKETGSTVIWKSAEGSLENQIALIEAFIEQKVDCILMDPIDAVALIPVIQEALNAGIPVVTMGNLVEGGVDDTLYNVCTTYPDVRDTSALTDLLIKAGGADKTYIGVMGTVGNFVSDTRQKAFEDACTEAGVEYLVSDGNWDSTQTLKVTQDMVTQAGDKLGGLYNLDDSMCLISMQATPKGLAVAGHNGEEAAFEKIESGEMLATVLIGGSHIGYWNILTATQLAEGQDLPHQVYLKTYIVMTEETQAKYWDGELAEKYPDLPVLTPEEARKVAKEPAEMLEEL